MFTTTAQHQAFFDLLLTSTDSIALRARAGCGKTTTQIEAMARLPSTVKIGYTSFAKKNIDDVKPKLAKKGLLGRVTATGMHAAGLKAITRGTGKRVVVDQHKADKILKSRLNDDEYKAFKRPVLALADKARQIGDMTDDGLTACVERFEIEAPGNDEKFWPRAFDITRKLVSACGANLATVDFADMLYTAVRAFPKAFDRFDVLFVDEAQDLSPIQRDMLRCMLAPGGRVVAVGDDRQAIYAFRGADSDSFDNIVAEFKCTSLPLNRSYRCPKAVAVEAQRYVPDFEVAESNAEGVVSTKAWQTVAEKLDLRPTDMMICRNTAPAVKMAFALIRRNVPCRVLGRDIADGLVRLVRSFDAVDLRDMLEKLNDWSDKAVAKLPENDRNREAKIENIMDKVATICAIAEQVETVVDLIDRLTGMFSDENTRDIVTLSTVHKVKGAEAPRVFILCPELMPSSKAKTPEAMLQEENLAYVAVTRAQEELVYVPGP